MIPVIGVTMVKDEADVIDGVLAHQLGELDAVVVVDHGSGDSTRDRVRALRDGAGRDRVLLLDEPDKRYRQSAIMSKAAETGVARFGRGERAWVVPFDADELWTAPTRLADWLRGIADPNVWAVRAQLWDYRTTAIDPVGEDPFRVMHWRQRDPAPLTKMAVRWRAGTVIEQGNHGANRRGRGIDGIDADVKIAHFQYRGSEHFVAKVLAGARAYLADPDRDPTHGAHWLSYWEIANRLGQGALHEVYREHHHFISPVDAGLVHDPAPYRRWELGV